MKQCWNARELDKLCRLTCLVLGLLITQGLVSSGRKDELELRLAACSSQEAGLPPVPSTPSSSHKRSMDAPPELLRKLDLQVPAQDGVASAQVRWLGWTFESGLFSC